MAGKQKAGRPRVLHRRIVQDTTKEQREHEERLLKDKSLADLLKTGLTEGLSKAPEIALLGGGFYLGYAMNMRPGIEVPSPLGGTVFIGLPDFGGKVEDLTDEVERHEANVKSLKQAATLITVDQDCVGSCEEQRRAFAKIGKPFDFDACVAACTSEDLTLNDQIREAEAKLARLKGELQKHRVAQGFLFLIMTWTLTRPGFLTGIGEIIPG